MGFDWLSHPVVNPSSEFLLLSLLVVCCHWSNPAILCFDWLALALEDTGIGGLPVFLFLSTLCLSVYLFFSLLSLLQKTASGQRERPKAKEKEKTTRKTGSVCVPNRPSLSPIPGPQNTHTHTPWLTHTMGKVDQSRPAY